LRIPVFDPVRAYIDALVHPSARTDSMTSARHRAFIAARLLGGLIALAIMPVHFALRGAPSPLEAVIFAWLLSPVIAAWYLSRTGAYERAYLLSSAMLATLIGVVAGATGGMASFIAPWIVLLPFEAALSASRRVVIVATAYALLLMTALWSFGHVGLLPQSPSGWLEQPTLFLLGTLTASLYATALALGASSLARFGERVKNLGEFRYRLLAQHSTDVVSRHTRNGSTLFVSPAGEKLAGVACIDLLGHGLFDRVHVADRPAYLNAIADATAAQEPVTIEYRLRRGPLSFDGHSAEPQFVWVEMRCHPAERAPGMDQPEDLREVVAVTRDITRRKHDALELEAAHAEAAQANSAKGRFLATVSHELRTPLNAIIGFSEMLKKEKEISLDQERRLDYARLINESGQHLLAVVNGILDVSRIEAGHFEVTPESFAVSPLAESCYEMMLLRAEQAGLDLELNVAPDLPEVRADKVALRQVLINLISNAIKFTPRGGQVDISVDVDDRDLIVVVEDTGIGIAESDLVQLGNPFFQVKGAYDRPYEGTGLGLSVVKGLVGLHGGRIDIKSRLGHGTSVVVRLPRNGEKNPQKETGVVEVLKPRQLSAEPQANQWKVKKRA
jgi:two-component system, cell cycle sensor histidine kinase DivJ